MISKISFGEILGDALTIQLITILDICGLKP